MVKKAFPIFLALCVLMLSSCSAQSGTDIYGFGERFNKRHGEDLNISDYYLSSDGQYNCFFSLCDECEALISLTVSQDASVSLAQLTAARDGFEYSESSRLSLYNCFFDMCLVLLNASDEQLTADFNKFGFSADSIAFAPFDLVFEVTGGDISVFTNEEMISMYCEKK